jgi:hypothetical protein
LRLEVFPREFDLIGSQPDITQTENAFDIRSDGVVLAATGIPQLK